MPKFPKYDNPTLLFADEALRSTSPTGITLFSGLGSSSKALRDLGFNVLAHDFMPEAVASLNANGFDAVQGDIRKVHFANPLYRNVKIIVGGPPCQPFSQNGRNAGEDDTRDMIPDFQRAVAHILPEVFVLENVRGLAGPRHRDYLARRVSELEALGYVVDYRVLDCSDYGVGQRRKRLFIIGRRVDLSHFGPALKVRWPEKQAPITMAEALGWSDLGQVWDRNQQAPEAARVPFSDRRWKWVFEQPSTTVVASFRPEVQAAPGYRTAGDGPRQNAPGSVVTTIEERLALQGLPRDWKVIGSETKRGLQVGNSCPTPVLRALVSRNLP